jgi:hypothetical protein
LPDASLYIINAPAKEGKGYNLKHDYDSQGNLKPDAKPKFIKAEKIEDLNKYMCTDQTGQKNIQIYIGDIRDELTQCRQKLMENK